MSLTERTIRPGCLPGVRHTGLISRRLRPGTPGAARRRSGCPAAAGRRGRRPARTARPSPPRRWPGRWPPPGTGGCPGYRRTGEERAPQLLTDRREVGRSTLARHPDHSPSDEPNTTAPTSTTSPAPSATSKPAPTPSPPPKSPHSTNKSNNPHTTQTSGRRTCHPTRGPPHRESLHQAMTPKDGERDSGNHIAQPRTPTERHPKDQPPGAVCVTPFQMRSQNPPVRVREHRLHSVTAKPERYHRESTRPDAAPGAVLLGPISNGVKQNLKKGSLVGPTSAPVAE